MRVRMFDGFKRSMLGMTMAGLLACSAFAWSADDDVAVKPTTRPTKVPASLPSTRPTTGPATAPSTRRSVSSDDMLGQMFAPSQANQAKPLAPAPEAGGNDRTSGPGAVKPNAPAVPTLREGTVILDRVGRLHRSSDGQQMELVFESDGVAMKDPPMILVPNLQLMSMENAVAGSARDLRFRVTGTVTEYRGRNYLLLTKILVIPDVLQQF